MDELKVLVEMVSHLPAMAMWVLVGFWAYKVVVIGSLYGVIRFVAGGLFGYLKARKTEVQYQEIRPMLDGVCISGTVGALMGQLHRLRGVNVSIGSTYIHDSSVEWLRQAIDEKMDRDAATKSRAA